MDTYLDIWISFVTFSVSGVNYFFEAKNSLTSEDIRLFTLASTDRQTRNILCGTWCYSSDVKGSEGLLESYTALCGKQKTLVGQPRPQEEGLTILQTPVITHQSTRPSIVRDESSGTQLLRPLILIYNKNTCILYTWVRASWIEFNNCPTRCDLFSLLYFCRQLYMFRVLTPIIRSLYSCNYSFWYWLTAVNKIRCY